MSRKHLELLIDMLCVDNARLKEEVAKLNGQLADEWCGRPLHAYDIGSCVTVNGIPYVLVFIEREAERYTVERLRS